MEVSVIAIEDELGLQVCQRQPLVIERGQGVRVWDDTGRSYLDFTSGWGVTCLGHAHPRILSALVEQAGKVIQNPNSGFTYSPARARALKALYSVLPPQLSRIYFANSGAEANDAALKLARKITGRQRVLAMEASFHGRTLATLSVSGGPENSARYLPRLPDHEFVALNDIARFEQLICDEVAAVILEPIQGEGGVRAVDGEFLRTIQRRCQETGALLIIDEVQTGFGRTGRFFAVEHLGICPDIMTMGKGIAGGLAFAALALRPEVAAGVQPGDHGSTYAGNPLACAVSAAVIEELQRADIMAHVQTLSPLVMQDLMTLQAEFPQVVVGVRGHGLMLALDLADDGLVWPLTTLCQEYGLLVTPTRNAVLRLLPPLIMTLAEWQQGLVCLRAALSALQTTRLACA